MMFGHNVIFGNTYPGSLRSPLDIANMAWWYDAALSPITLVSGKVSVQGDLSGLARDLGQATAASRPTIVLALTGLQAVRYDGVDDFMSATFAQAMPYTRFIVGKWQSSFAAQSSMVDGLNGNNSRIYRLGNAETHLNAGAEIVDSTDDNRTFRTYTINAKGAGSGFYVDRVLIGSATLTGNALGGITHGAFGGGSVDWSDVDIVCDLGWTRTLTSGERTQVWDWLSHRTGLP